MSAFVLFLDTLFVSRDYTRMFNASENKAISDVRRGRADIMAIPEKVLTNLRSHIEMVSGGSAVAAFDMWLARAYAAYNLRPFQNRLEGHHVHRRTLAGWLDESRSISPGWIDRLYNILGIRVDHRPVVKKDNTKMASKHAQRYKLLCLELQTEFSETRIEELEIELQFSPEDRAVRLVAGKNSVEIAIDAENDVDEFIDVTDGGEAFPDDSYSDYAKAIAHAFELIAEYREEDAVKMADNRDREKAYDTLEALVRKRLRAGQIKDILTKSEFSREKFSILLSNVEHNLSGELHVYKSDQGVNILASFYKGMEKTSQETFSHNASAFNFVLDAIADEIADDDDEDDEEDVEEDSPREAFKKRTDELVNTLRNTDPDDHINYSGHKVTHQAADQWMVNLLDADKVKGLRIVAYRDRPADKLFSLNEGTICIGNYPDVKSVLEAAMNRFLAMREEDDEDAADDINYGDDEVPPRSGESKKKKKAKKSELYSDDEEDTSALSKFAQKRCAGLAKFAEYRQTLLEDADGDEEDLSSLYGELRRIATHPLVHIMAAYWPKSFRFTLVSADEEAPIFNFFCNNFDITIRNEFIEIVEFIDGATDDDTDVSSSDVDGSLTYRVHVSAQLTTMQRMNRVMKYFSTWNEARMNALLMQSGFEFDDGETEGLCVGSESVNILPFVGVPSTFFSEEDAHYDQIKMDDNHYTLEDFLRDECYNLRGAQFKHDEGPNYEMEFGQIGLTMTAVAGGTVVHDHTLMVANSNSAKAFYLALQNETITLDWLRNKCVVVEEKAEYVSLEFKVDTSAYVVHIYR